jgi:outer membrane protein
MTSPFKRMISFKTALGLAATGLVFVAVLYAAPEDGPLTSSSTAAVVPQVSSGSAAESLAADVSTAATSATISTSTAMGLMAPSTDGAHNNGAMGLMAPSTDGAHNNGPSAPGAGSDETLPDQPDLVSNSSPGASSDLSTGSITLDKVSVENMGTQLLVLIQTSKPVQCFIFERRDPPSLYIQFIGSTVYAGGDPIQVVGTDPLSEIRYGFTSFHDAASATRDETQKFPLDYIQLRLNRPVFYHVQQEGWVISMGLDRSTTKVDVPDLNFRFDKAKYEGADNLPPDPRIEHFVEVAQANSRLLSVARDEAELAKTRVFEAERAIFPALTARLSTTNGVEVNPFSADAFNGFQTASYRREEYGVEITQPIFESGRLYGAYRQAKLNRLMALENVRKQAQDLTYEMKKAYFTLLKNQDNLRIRRELVAQGEVVKEMAKKKLDLQLTTKAEVLNISAQTDQAAYQLASDEQDVALSRLVVISLLNQANPVSDPVPGELPFGRLSFNVESIINWAQEHRPDVRIATLNSELAKYAWKAAQADNRFKLDASGFYGRAGAAYDTDVFGTQVAYNIGLRATENFGGNSVKLDYSKENSAPDLGQTFATETNQRTVEVGLLDAMPTNSAVKQAELQYQRSQAELVEASRKAEYEVRQTYYNLEKAARQLEAVRQDLQYRSKDLDITREKVRLGLAELSQLMTAQVAYTQAQITEQDALSAYNVALADMDRVAGAEVVKE